MAKKSTTTKGMKIVPLGDRVVLKRADAMSTTKGGIVLPDTARDKPQKGEVVAVGNGLAGRRQPARGDDGRQAGYTEEGHGKRMPEAGHATTPAGALTPV